MSNSHETDWKPPRLFDGYRVLWTLGRTEHSTVCMGQDTVLDRPCTIRFFDFSGPGTEQRERFLSEARGLAKLQHPNIVTTHRVGVIDSRPYIINEYLRGQTVEQVQKPMPWRQALAIALAAIGGLAAAHRKGVLHRGLRPGSLIVGSDQTVKLGDFGLLEFCGEDISILRQATEQGAEQASLSAPELLSPQNVLALRERMNRFFAPEVFAKEPLTQRADLFAFGVIFYELLLGKLPNDAMMSQPVPDDLGSVGFSPDIDQRFVRAILRCLRAKPAERFSSSDELEVALEQLVPRGGVDKIPDGNPYRGLLPFEAEHRSLFFGRRSEVGTLLERLRTDACVLVAADSGVGKSSLCRAGVLPLVVEGALGGGRSWQVATLVPGRHPLRSLGQALYSLCAQTEDSFAEGLSADPERLSRWLHARLGTDRGLLVFLDQLEELSTIAQTDEARVVSEALGCLLSRLPGVRLLVTVRSDYLGRVASLPGIGEAVTRCLYILRPLGPDKIREAVVGPAHVKGVLFENPELVNGLVDSTTNTDGALPLLQFTLAELWEARQGNRITHAVLEQIGGVNGALSRHADHVVGSLPPLQRQSARRVLMNLVTLEGTRARRTEDELVNEDPNAKVALETLVRGRLLVARDTPEGAAFEVAHEALIRGWGTLRRWLEENAESRAAKQRLEQAAAEWRRLQHKNDALWSATQLAEAVLIDAADISPKEQEFLSASRQRVAGHRFLRRLLALSVPVILVLVYGVFEYIAHQRLVQRLKHHVNEGKTQLALARGQAQNVEALRKTAFAAFDAAKMDDGEKLWAQVLAQSVDADRAYSRASQLFEAALTFDANHQEGKRLLADVLYERALAAERDGRTQQTDDLLQRLALYDSQQTRRRMWEAPAHLSLATTPTAIVRLGRFERDDKNRRTLTGIHELGKTPLLGVSLAPGSYVLFLDAPGHEGLRYPLALSRGEVADFRVDLLPTGKTPDGFVYIPKGRFLFGTTADETMRKSMLSHVPIHTVFTNAYFVAKHETTFGEWIAFLNDLPPPKRAAFLHKSEAGALTGSIALDQLPTGEYELQLQPTVKKFVARENQKLVYDARTHHREHNWLRLPVTGITAHEAQQYAAWLAQTGRLPGARLCTELEWERAAKGADDREWPHGDDLAPGDANFDMTYSNTDPQTMGPDEVGSYPQSQSPFGVFDMAGNALEWTLASVSKSQFVVRSGSFFYSALVQRATNRNEFDASLRNPGLSTRICASASP